jgi:DNA-cytosine methyltransferase
MRCCTLCCLAAGCAELAEQLSEANSVQQIDILQRTINRITVHKNKLEIAIAMNKIWNVIQSETTEHDEQPVTVIEVPVELKRCGMAVRLIVRAPGELTRRQSDPKLVARIAKAHKWFAQLSSGRCDSIRTIARQEKVTSSYVTRVVHLAFLAPDIVQRIVKGEHPVELNIQRLIPDHDVLLAGFSCQPFSIAGVSKKNALGRAHGFECKTQGTLFFDVAKILEVKRPAAFMLENVKNLKSHDKGRTFKVITETLDELGYWVADVDVTGSADPKIIDGQHFVPQHRERIILVGFRRDLGIHEGFTLRDVEKLFPKKKLKLGDILEKSVDEKYILTPKLWEYLFNYAIKHKAKGNGFGYGLVGEESVTRTLSARYYKDGSEILINRGFDPSKDFYDPQNLQNRPRRLTPRECARLMGYDKPDGAEFRIPVSDTQAYKQFGNSVVVPVFTAVAQLMKPRIRAAVKLRKQAKAKLNTHDRCTQSGSPLEEYAGNPVQEYQT